MNHQSQLYRLDRQIWDILVAHLEGHVVSLLDCGDKTVNRMCVSSVHILMYPPPHSNLLFGALKSNLKALQIEGPKEVCPNLPPEMLSRLIGESRLLELNIHFLRTDWQLTLPATLTHLSILVVHETDNPLSSQANFLQLGGAHLAHISIDRIRHRRTNTETDLLLESSNHCTISHQIHNDIVKPCHASLTFLGWRSPDTIPLQLARMTSLTSLAIHNQQLIKYVHHFETPPYLERLSIHGKNDDGYGRVMSSVATMFPNTLTLLDLHNFGSGSNSSELDISMLAHVQDLRITYIKYICCAPATQLEIRCHNGTITRLQNNGRGTVRLYCGLLHLNNIEILQGTIVNAMCWSSLRRLVLECIPGPFNRVDNDMWSNLKMATNIEWIEIVNDSLPFFLYRDGDKFFQNFSKLRCLEWRLTHTLCIALSNFEFALPNTIAILSMDIEGGVPATTGYLANDHMLSYLKHTPEYLSLNGFPLSPKLIDMCNNAATPFELGFQCHHVAPEDEVDVAWMEPLTPSPNVMAAQFSFPHTLGQKSQKLLQYIFGPYWDPTCANAIYTTSTR